MRNTNRAAMLAIAGVLVFPKIGLGQCREPVEQSLQQDSVLLQAAAMLVRASKEVAGVWPGFWAFEHPFVLARRGGCILLVSRETPGPEFLPTHIPRTPKLAGLTYVRRSADGFPVAERGGFELRHRTGSVTATAVAVRDDPVRTIEFLLHEAFHAYQRRIRMAALQLSPDSAFLDWEYNVLAELERTILSSALQSIDRDLKKALNDYFMVRSYREAMFPSVTTRERFVELTEGTAHYVGIRGSAIAAGSDDYPRQEIYDQLTRPLEFQPVLMDGRPVDLSDQTVRMQWTHRARLYPTGAALALVLDRLAVDWQQEAASSADSGRGLGDVAREAIGYRTQSTAEEVADVLVRYGIDSIESRVRDLLTRASVSERH
jgi:hypothetical protein